MHSSHPNLIPGHTMQNPPYHRQSTSQYPQHHSHLAGGGLSPLNYDHVIPVPTTPGPDWTPINAHGTLHVPYWTDAQLPRKYPQLHPILIAEVTTVRYDVRKKPKASLPRELHKAYRGVHACSSSPMLLFSKSFPWSIALECPPGTLISCEMIWDAIYCTLQEPIAATEWGMLGLLGDERQKDVVQTAAKKRKHRHRDDSGLKRIDWLGDATMFIGLEKNEEFAKRMILPGVKPSADAWVMKFALR